MGTSIAFIIILLMFATVVRFSRKLLYDDFTVDLNESDYSNRIIRLAEGLRLPNRRGAGVDSALLKGVINNAFKIIKNKVRKAESLFEYEKWLYDNHYIIKRNLTMGCFDQFYKLPHCDNIPRVLTIARKLISYTGGKLTVEKLNIALSEINKVSPLTIKENFCFKEALIFAILEKIAGISKKCVFYRRLFKLAIGAKNIIKRYIKSNIYIYYVLKSNPKLSDKLKSYLNVEGESYDNVDYTFSSLIIENNILTCSLIKTLQTIDKFTDCINANLVSNKILETDEVYRQMDTTTKRLYLNEISRQSDSLNVDEITFSKSLLDLQLLIGIHSGSILFDYKRAIKAYIEKHITINLTKKRDNKEVFYSLAIFAISASGALILSYFATRSIFTGINIKIVLLYILLFAGLFIAFLPPAAHLTDTVFKLFIPTRPLAKMDYKNLPDRAKTLVVVPVFVMSAEEIAENVRHIREIMAVNKDKNINYALLFDFKAADYEVVEEDNKLIAEINKQLNGSTDISVLVRKREYQNGKFCGYERKRGAIEALNRYIIEKKGNDFKIFGKVLSKPTYVIILDADNTVVPNSIKSAVNTFLHPFNMQFDLLTFEGRTNLFSLKTPYSKRYQSSGGLEFYPAYSNFFYNLSGKSIFAGKGIYRVQAFYDKLCGKLPENKILSHDILEGGLLNTGITGEAVYEDAPLTFVSEAVRNQRWQRGDIQLLPFLKRKNLTACPQLSLLYKTVIFKNAVSVLSPYFAFMFFVIALFTANPYFLLLGGAAVSLSFIITFISLIFGIFSNKRLIYTLKDFLNSILNYINSLFMLPYYALSGVYVFFTTLFKMAKKGNLLQWKTFVSGQKSGSPAEFVKAVAPTLVMLVIITWLSFMTNYSIFALIYTIAFVLVFCVIFFSGKEKKAKIPASSNLLEYALKTYQYFVDFDKNGLIADHFNENPKGEPANYTSPTNIGFSLLSHISAEELGFITLGEAEERITKILNAVDKLKKWNGHLYNWYNITTLDPLEPAFVSCVDSGNFVACLMVVKAKFAEKLANRIENIIKNVDFNALYDNRKQLFNIGYMEPQDKIVGNYDLMASEARLLSYLGISLGTPTGHWQALSRELNGKRGNTLASWNGTMFEYLMPQIFLIEAEKSLLKTTAYNSAMVQAKTPCNGLFGISESGYYAFDENKNYQYEAYGIDSLGLRSSINKCVVSPYSSFLALSYISKRVENNLDKLKGTGMLGKYGFYEALDCTKAAETVEEYMAHHQGMSLAAIANYLNHDCIKKLFFEDVRISGAKMLLTERQPEIKATKKPKNKFLYNSEDVENYTRRIGGMLLKPEFNLIKSDEYAVAVDDYGQGYSIFNGIYINRFRKDERASCGAFFYVTDLESGEVISPTFAPLKAEGNFTVTFKRECSTYDGKNLKLDVECPHYFNGELRKLTIFNPTKAVKRYKIAYYSELSLSTMESDCSHQAFNNMFIRTAEKSVNERTNVITATRRFLDKDSHLYLASVVKGLSGFNAVTNRFNFIGRNRTEQNPIILEEFNPQKNDNGDVLEPCIGFIGEVIIGSECEAKIEVITSIATNADDSEKLINKALSPHFGEFIKEVPFVIKNVTHELSAQANEFVGKLFGKLLYLPLDTVNLKYIENNYERAKEITNAFYYKNIYYRFELGSEVELSELNRIIWIFKQYDVRARLIIGYVEKDYYFEDVKRAIMSVISEGVIGAEIILAELKEGDELFYKKTSFWVFNGFKINEKNLKGNIAKKGNVKKSLKTEFDFTTGEGGYSGDFYVVRPKGAATLLPYSNVICGEEGGTVTTESGGGYVYFKNSRENKTTVWENDAVKNSPSERFNMVKNDICTELNNENALHIYGKGISISECETDGMQIVLKQYMIKNGGVKVYEAEFKNLKDYKKFDLFFTLDLVLGWRPDNDYILTEVDNNLISAVNLKNKSNIYLKSTEDAVGIIKEKDAFSRTSGYMINPNESDYGGNAFGVKIKVEIPKLGQKTLFFAFSANKELIEKLDIKDIAADKKTSLKYFNALNPFKITSGNAALDRLFNDSLMYQVVSSRINGKTAFYQAGGAVGFRDVLQDTLALMYSDLERSKKIILDCAAHQYVEGDVQHWWHAPRWGVRTRISDDKLFLPYVVLQYIKASGDRSILEIEVPYLFSKPLLPYEKSRYEFPEVTTFTESLLSHVKIAIDNAYKLGKNGLILIQGGDWNDALDDVGDEKEGESVWLSMFMYKVLTDVVEHISGKDKLKYVMWAEDLQKAVDKCFDGYYKRLVTNKGEWLGEKNCESLKIDLISQAWAVLSGIAPKDKADSALLKAADLVDSENGIIKLLWPPANEDKYYGYISKYPYGVRENGGQYTHGAIWYIQALLKSGHTDEGYKLLRLINPIEKCADPNMVNIYKGEPYVLSADVYSNPQNAGRSGWSWYTGSASWCYKCILEDLLGIKLVGGALQIKPASLPKDMENIDIEYRIKDSVYKIKITAGDEEGFYVDGIKLNNGNLVPLNGINKDITVKILKRG